MTIFLAIAVAGLTFVAGGLLLGGHDADHDGFDHGGDGHGHGGVTVFSTRVLSTFAMGFGAAGAVAMSWGLGWLPASGVAALSGAALGLLMWALLSVLASQQGSSLVSTGELVGATAVVTTAIGPHAVGEVCVSYGDRSSTCLARSHSGAAISRGERVRVTRVSGSLVFVEEAARISPDVLMTHPKEDV